jgi:hypothetical protein
MTAAEYRAKAVRLLTSRPYSEVSERATAQAAVWAELATSAAIEENSQVTTDGK